MKPKKEDLHLSAEVVEVEVEVVPVAKLPAEIEELFTGAVVQAHKKDRAIKLISDRIRAIRGTMELNAFEVARLLWLVGENDLWKDSYESFKDYAEIEFGFAERAGYYLRKIWQKYAVDMSAKPGVLSLVEPIGWTKARILLPVVDESNVETWVEKAKVQSSKDLLREVQHARTGGEGKEPGSAEPAKQFTCTLKGEQIRAVDDAFDKAAKVAESDKKGHLLALICTDYSNSASAAGDSRTNVAEVFQRTANLFGVKVLVLKQGEVVLDMTRSIGGSDERTAED